MELKWNYHYKIHATFVEVMRQLGNKDWKLYSRWSKWGIGDLLRFYESKYAQSKDYEKISFDEWLIKKRILDNTHFKKIGNSLYLKYNYLFVDTKVNKICNSNRFQGEY